MPNLNHPGVSIVGTSNSHNLERYNDILNTVNTFKYKNHFPTVEVDQERLEDAFKNLENQKAFSAGSISTGSALIAGNTLSPLFYSDIEGGAFIKSGIDYRPNSSVSTTLPSLTINGSFVAQVCGTASTNEVSVFGRKDVALTSYTALIQGCEDVLARTTDPAELISVFEMALDNQKLILSDTLIAQTVTATGSGVIALDPTVVNSVGSIHLNMYRQIGILAKFSVNSRAKFYMTHSAFVRLLSEQDSTGRFLDCPCQLTQMAGPDGSVPTSGLVARFGTYDIILVGTDIGKGILETYTVSVSGVVTAQTTGTKTIIIFAVPQAIVLLRGRPEMDQIRVFDQSTDRASFLDGQVTVGARTYMGAGIYNPLRVCYFNL